MNEQELRRLLAEAVPEPDPSPDRAAAATWIGRRRRKRMAVIGTAGLALVVGLSVLGWRILDSRPDAVQPLTPASPCPAPDAPEWDEEADDLPPLERGVATLRLCYRGGAHPWQSVPDTLRGPIVEDLARFVDGLGVSDTPVCVVKPPADLIDGGFVFGYEDGSVRLLTANPTDCGGVVVSGEGRGGATSAEYLITSFITGVLDSRATSKPVAVEPISLDCAGTSELNLTLLPWPADLEVARAEVCTFAEDNSRSSVALTPAQVGMLEADLRERRGPRPEDACDQGFITTPRVGTGIYLESIQGDRYYTGSVCFPDFHLGSSPGYSSGPHEGWTPSPGLKAVLQELRDRAPKVQ